MTNNPRRILIIEDDPDSRADLRKMILCGSDRRHEFSEAELGATALKLVQENSNTPFDCILLEYHLPDIDAQQMLVAFCDGHELPPSPIVVLTGSDRQAGKELLRGGAQDYLGKGWITPESLTRAIDNAIERFAMLADSRVVQLKLEESETRYRRMFEAAHDGILIIGASTHKITHVNPFLTTLLDYPAEYFLGKELWEIGFLKDKQASVLAMQQLNKSGSIRYESLPLEDRHGQKHPVEMVANKYDEGMNPVIQCNIRDISERRKLEKQMLFQAAELSDLHRRKDEFLAMLSHELRSPLAPIANAVQLLGLPNEFESILQRQARGIIERQVGQLQHLVDDLLEVSRITTGRVQLRQERVAIGGIINGAVETARPLIDQRKHELNLSMPQESLWLNADAARLEQVVVNLLTNAAKYTEEGGHIWLSVLAEGNECVIRVRDTGVGIAPALLPKIFDLFTQAERSLDRSQGGLGIGLALVQRLTDLHGGRVEVHSSLGQGSEFVVRLPLIAVELEKAAPISEMVDPKKVRPLRVLVVDDNVDTVLSFSMLLKASGHDVFTANDGLSAVQVASETRPDVVLLDIGLPGINGYEVAKRIRQQPGGEAVVLIALTGYGQDTDRQLSAQAGFNHHLVKPARLEQVKEILAAAAEQRNRNA